MPLVSKRLNVLHPSETRAMTAKATALREQGIDVIALSQEEPDFAMYLLEQFGIAVVPGSEFMASPYFRISYASSLADLQRAYARILAACEALSESEKIDEQSKTIA